MNNDSWKGATLLQLLTSQTFSLSPKPLLLAASPLPVGQNIWNHKLTIPSVLCTLHHSAAPLRPVFFLPVQLCRAPGMTEKNFSVKNIYKNDKKLSKCNLWIENSYFATVRMGFPVSFPTESHTRKHKVFQCLHGFKPLQTWWGYAIVYEPYRVVSPM